MNSIKLFSLLCILALTSSAFVLTNTTAFNHLTQLQDTSQINHNKTIQLLTQKWVSTAYMSDSGETPFKGGFTIHFKSDRSFTSFYKPDNHKKGYWYLSNDSTFVLSMKDVDDFRIIELNDSILVAKTLWNTNNRIYKFKCQKQKKQ